jgi:O-antigen/teichoic acid export membrane protein
VGERASEDPTHAEKFWRRFRTGVGWNSAGTIFSQGSTFVVNLIVANTLGRRAFGEYAIVLSTLATLSNVAQFAMGFTATKFLAQFREADKQRAGRILAACGVLAVTSAGLVSLILLLAARKIAETVYREPGLAGVFAIASAALLFAVLNGFLLGALAGLEAYRLAGIAGITSGCLYVVICIAGVRVGQLPGVLAGMGISGVVQTFLLGACLRRACGKERIRLQWEGLRRERAAILHFAAPAALAGILQMSSLWLAGVILARRPDGISQMALFSAANTFWIALMFLPNIANNVGLSLLNNARGRGDLVALRRVFWLTLRFSALVTIVGGAACAVMAPRLMALFGSDFLGGGIVLVVLLLSALPCIVWFAVAQVIASDGSMWHVLAVGVLPRDCCLILGAGLLVPRLGALGLGAAVSLAWAAGLLGMLPSCGRMLSRERASS